MSVVDDRYRAMQMVHAVAPMADLTVVVHPGEPAVKARARVVRGHAYTPQKTVQAQAALAARLSEIRFESNVAVACVFTRKSQQRADVDNMLKLVLDAATQAGVWADDSQVTAMAGVVELDRDEPRTVLAFADHQSSLRRGVAALDTCERCEKRYHAAGGHARGRRYCSRECRYADRIRTNCPTCGTEFEQSGAGRRVYCSVACRGKGQRADKACAQCGAQRAKSDSTLCRSCWLAAAA